MCPLVAQPNRGYADYQRVGNWDTGILWRPTPTLGTATVTSPIIDVSRFARLGGYVRENTSMCKLNINWFADAVGAVQLTQRTIVLESHLSGGAQLLLPNLGPYVQLAAQAISGVAFTFIALIIATNRTHPLEIVPDNALLLDVQNLPVAASASVTLYPLEYYAGPAVVWFDPAFTAGDLALQTLDSGGTWHYVNQLTFTAVTQTSPVWVIPAGAWRMVVTNSTGAGGNVYLAVAPPTTGAA